MCKCPDKEFCNPKTGQCSCFAGYLGLKCDKPCSNVTYGQDCLHKCSCKPPMKCDHINGSCYCPAGYKGDFCDIKCTNGTYGRNCTKGLVKFVFIIVLIEVFSPLRSDFLI